MQRRALPPATQWGRPREGRADLPPGADPGDARGDSGVYPDPSPRALRGSGPPPRGQLYWPSRRAPGLRQRRLRLRLRR
eukprot:8673386-Pyramimonas_sp.AAC.1